ncbi:MAG: (Fe-S)-binding protein [Chloroflexi bacterium]|nr:(Fe-S)-binding protein [Chloroflexota bacterium]
MLRAVETDAARNNHLLAEYDNMLRCIRCAACLTACPTYVIDHKEEEGPRGRIAIMRALAEGHLPLTEDAVRHVSNCLLCDACSHVCPSGVEMEPLGIAFREAIRHEGAKTRRRFSLLEQFAYRWLFGDLGHFRAMAQAVRFLQLSGLHWLGRRLGIVRLLGLKHADDLLPPIPREFVRPEGQRIGRGRPSQVFAGCVMSTVFGPTTERTAKLLAAFGCEASLPAGQVCCGALQLHAGDRDRALELARQNIEAFGEADDPIIVNAAGCGAVLKRYGELLPGEPRAARLAARVLDVSEFLAKLEPPPAREVRTTVVLQEACHLLHAQRIAEQPRALLQAIPGLKLRRLAEPGLCCGSAGIYNLGHRRQAEELRRRKCDNIIASGAETVVTANPGCLLQIRPGLPKSIKVRHIVDLLAETYL